MLAYPREPRKAGSNRLSLRASGKMTQSSHVPDGGNMRQVVIENPILNSPFGEPTLHFKFSDEGITNEQANGRRPSSYFIPIARPRTAPPNSARLTPSGRRTG